MNAGQPIYLTASVTINPNSQGAPNTLALMNPTGEPMELLAVRWVLRPTTPGSQVIRTGSVIACKLDLGNIPITNGFVPVPLFGPAHLSYNQEGNQTATPFVHEWKLDYPLPIPAGATVAPSFMHRGISVVTPYAIEVSYSCRAATRDKVRGKVRVPYVASWVSTPQDMYDGTRTEESSRETDLVNRFDTPIKIHRFTGRFDTTVLQRDDPPSPVSPPIVGEFTASPGSFLYDVRMSDAQGERVIPYYTPFRQVFCPVTRAWEVPHEMPPHRFYIVDAVKQTVSDANASVMVGQASIGMVASREVGGLS